MVPKKQITAFQKEILEWFAKNKRDLPWRKSRDPYNILISEVMLQQTQVGRVILKFETWMRKFPTMKHVAKASVRDVLLLWSGLGYNRRAMYLKKLAEELVKNHNSTFSQNEDELVKLSGIGKYTARAILCFAFDQQIAVVDTNVRKVILTKFGKYVKDTPKEIQKFADLLLPKGKAYEWNQALMDYASANLKKEKIIIPKQSKFKDSDRYFRGEILRLLLKHPKSSIKKIEKHLLSINKAISRERLQKILSFLIKEKFIHEENGEISLAT